MLGYTPMLPEVFPDLARLVLLRSFFSTYKVPNCENYCRICYRFLLWFARVVVYYLRVTLRTNPPIYLYS